MWRWVIGTAIQAGDVALKLGCVALIGASTWVMVDKDANDRFTLRRADGAPAQPSSAQSSTGDRVAETSLRWAGRDYKPDVRAMCASFIRTVLREAGVELGVARGSAGPLMADSFHGGELGQIILNPSELQRGDIVMFANTYNGPGRSPIPGRGRITHVGIYLGGGMMVDRPTAARPVQHRPISTFQFHSALRPNSYQAATPAPAATQGQISDDLLKRAIGRAEGTRDANGNPTQAFFGHTDPGWQGRCPNIGSFSFQHCANSPEEADQR